MKLLVNKNKMASFATDLLEKFPLPEQNRSVEMTLKIYPIFKSQYCVNHIYQ